MSVIGRLLDANKSHVAARGNVTAPLPARGLAVLDLHGCPDRRTRRLGLEPGDAVVLAQRRRARHRRRASSLALATHKLGVETVVVMQHTDCGVWGVTDEHLQSLTGADLGFLPIDDHADALRADIELLATKPYLERVKEMAGFVYDVATGEVTDVVRWNRPPGP